jgi:hypothetical protein
MNFEACGPNAIATSDGRVVIINGVRAIAEIYDPAAVEAAVPEDTDAAPGFRIAGRMTVSRRGHSATLMPDGRVLVAGGQDPYSTGSMGKNST